MSDFNTKLQTNNTNLQTVLQTLQIRSEGSEQATPVISMDQTKGLITATAGSKSSTHQLPVRSGPITPSADSQVAIPAGQFTNGDVTVSAIPTQTKTVTPQASAVNVTPSAYKFLSKVTVNGDGNLVADNIRQGVSIFGITGTYSSPIEPCTYTVDSVANASYGFALNSDGYYESQNKGQNDTYAICRVNLNVESTCDLIFDVINHAESDDYVAIFGNLDTPLSLSNSTNDEAKKSFRGQQSASVVNVIYNRISVGSHFIDIKFTKNNFIHEDTDSVCFKLYPNFSEISNGTKWTQSNGTSGGFECVYNANGVWVACNGGSKGLYYSTDGMTWTQSDITSGTFYSVYNANGIWVAGSFNNGLYYSATGKHWAQSNITSGRFYSVYNANGIWVAGSYNNGLYYSTSARTWSRSNITSGSFECAYNANGIWVAGSYGNGLYYSADGKTWTQSNINSGYFNSVYNANGMWVACADRDYGLCYSTDGMAWIQSNITSGSFSSVYNANGIWVACSNYYGLYYSTNGKSWTKSNITSGSFECAYNANGIWVACSEKGLYYSTDGKTWTQSNITSGTFDCVYNANGIWVAGSFNNSLYYSISC